MTHYYNDEWNLVPIIKEEDKDNDNKKDNCCKGSCLYCQSKQEKL